MNPGDLLTDLDVLAEDYEAGTGFGDSPIAAKRQSAVTWAYTRMERRGLTPRLHSVRYEPRAYSLTGSTWTDISSTVSSKTSDDLQLSSAIQSGADYLLIGSPLPFRGLYVAMLDSVNVNSLSVVQVTYWDGGRWATPSSVADGTLTNSISLSGGGRITWSEPTDWQRRPYASGLDATTPWFYYARLKFTNVPSASARVGQLLPIRMSRLTRPMALYSLGLLYQEGVAGTRGNWQDKATRYLQMAESELEMVLGSDAIRDEFDVDESEAVAATEVSSTTPPAVEWLRG